MVMAATSRIQRIHRNKLNDVITIYGRSTFLEFLQKITEKSPENFRNLIFHGKLQP